MKFIGGVIYLDKSFVYLVDFTFKLNRDYYFILIDNLEAILLVRDEYNIRKPLSIIEASKEKENL